MVADGVVYVAWQNQETRAIYPVGRLMEREVQPRFEFTYIAGVDDGLKAGFAPFLAFPDLDRAYRGDELFPLFQNRLMPENRPEYPEYLARLGLHSRVGPVTILLRSGGQRATDRVELFGRPLVDSQRELYLYDFFVRAVRHVLYAEDVIRGLVPDATLRCLSDWQNPADEHAIALSALPTALVGFVPQYIAEDLAGHARARDALPIRVLRVNPDPVPVQHRLFCRLEAPFRDGFRPFGSQRYDPRVADAWKLPPLSAPIAS